MRRTICCSVLVAGALFVMTGERAEAGGRRGCYWMQPQVIYVMPATGGYYYPAPATPPQRAAAPKQATAPRSQGDEGTFYFTPGGAVAPTRPAAPLTPAYPSPIESFEYNQPAGWWWR
jgi:hypothetical protein